MRDKGMNPIAVELGIEMKTTFWSDFDIAERFGLSAVRDTYERSMKSWGTNVSYAKELVMVLNHKIWQHHGKNPALSALYNQIWEEADNQCFENFKKDSKALKEYVDFLD
jgi:hypothetical protein